RLLALKLGKIPAATLGHPQFILAQRARVMLLWDFFKEVEYPWSEIATTRSQIQLDRDPVRRYMRAHLEGIALFKKDPEFAKKVMKKTLRLDDDSLAQGSCELIAKSISTTGRARIISNGSGCCGLWKLLLQLRSLC